MTSNISGIQIQRPQKAPIVNMRYVMVPGTGAEEAAEQTMVSVLCSQRDRFRKRNTELEEELAQV